MKINNLFIAILFFSIPATSLAQTEKSGKPFTLHGMIADPKLDSVSMLYINTEGKVSRQVLATNHGEFTLSGNISQPTMAYILFIHKGEKLSKRDAEIKTNKVFIEPGEMTITQQADELGYMQVKGSKAQYEWNELKHRTSAVQASIDSVAKLNTSTAHGGSNRNASPALRKQLAMINYDYFVSHPGSFVAANQVMFFTSVFNTDTLKQLYDHYTPEVKESMEAKRLAAELKSRTLGLPGTMAFQFTVADKEGKNLSLADFKGKYVLLDFWATWCVPCRAAMPHMVSLYKKYAAKNYAVIAIGDDDNRVKEWADAIDHDGIGMFHHTLRGVNTEMSRKGIPNPRDLDEGYGIHALPTLILVDPNGKIIGRFGSDEEELDKMLASIFKN